MLILTSTYHENGKVGEVVTRTGDGVVVSFDDLTSI